MRCRFKRLPTGLRPREGHVDQPAFVFVRSVKERQTAVAMAEEPQHRRHPVNARLDRFGDFLLCIAQCGPDVYQVPQNGKLHRRAAGKMTPVA